MLKDAEDVVVEHGSLDERDCSSFVETRAFRGRFNVPEGFRFVVDLSMLTDELVVSDFFSDGTEITVSNGITTVGPTKASGDEDFIEVSVFLETDFRGFEDDLTDGKDGGCGGVASLEIKAEFDVGDLVSTEIEEG